MLRNWSVKSVQDMISRNMLKLIQLLKENRGNVFSVLIKPLFFIAMENLILYYQLKICCTVDNANQ